MDKKTLAHILDTNKKLNKIYLILNQLLQDSIIDMMYVFQNITNI